MGNLGEVTAEGFTLVNAKGEAKTVRFGDLRFEPAAEPERSG